jgi:Spy/CpxP family protein refolding chaperone
MARSKKMKRQWMSVIANGFAGVAAVCILQGIATTVVVIPPAHAGSDALSQIQSMLVGIQLTPQQKQQIEGIVIQTLPQIQNVLSASQREQLKTALTDGKDLKQAMMSLNLSMLQKRKLLNIAQLLRSQISEILTDAQKQQLEQNLRKQLQTNH